jgi:hypothetical protein
MKTRLLIFELALAFFLFGSSTACDDDETDSTDAAADANTSADAPADLSPGDTQGGDAGADAQSSG